MKQVIEGLVSDLNIVQRRIGEDEAELKSHKNMCDRILERMHRQEALEAQIKKALKILQ